MKNTRISSKILCGYKFIIHNYQFVINKNKKGQAIAEFAIMLPLILILVVGAVQIGLLIQSYLTISQITRDGARYAAANPTKDDSQIANYIRGTSPSYSGGINPASFYGGDFSISVTPAYPPGGNLPALRRSGYTIMVTVSYNLKGTRAKLFIPTNFLGLQLPTSITNTATFIID